MTSSDKIGEFESWIEDDMISEDDSKGMALVGMSVALSILSRLEAKRIIAPQDTDAVLEEVLNSLEEFLPAADPGVRKARILVAAMAQIAARRRDQSPQLQ